MKVFYRQSTWHDILTKTVSSWNKDFYWMTGYQNLGKDQI